MSERTLKQTTGGPASAGPPPALVSPESLDPRGTDLWRVNASRDLTGSTNPTDRSMVVPLADSEGAEAVRAHELLHARLTPATLMARGRKAGCADDSLQACEDLRLNLAARTVGLDAIERSPITSEQAIALIDSLTSAARGIAATRGAYGGAEAGRLLHRAACVRVALAGTRHEALAAERLGETAPMDVAQAAEQATTWLNHHSVRDGGVAGSKHAIQAAKYLDMILERHVKPPPSRDPGGDPNNTTKLKPPDALTGEAIEASIDALKVFTPELTERMGKGGHTYRATAESGTLYRPSEAMRLDGTGLPFRRRRKHTGAAVLLDASGSMGFDHEVLAGIIASVPGSIVMLHASGCFGNQGREQGTFAVVGRDGRCISAKGLEALRQQLGGGNANDAGACLLAGRLADKAKVKGPRWWVTDRGWGDNHGSIGAAGVHEACTAAAKRTGFRIAEHESMIFEGSKPVDLQFYCGTCGDYYAASSDSDRACPECGQEGTVDM